MKKIKQPIVGFFIADGENYLCPKNRRKREIKKCMETSESNYQIEKMASPKYKLSEKTVEKLEELYSCYYYSDKTEITLEMRLNLDIIVSVGDLPRFQNIYRLPARDKYRWLAYPTEEKLYAMAEALTHCHVAFSLRCLETYYSGMVSVFTTSYKSVNRIERPFRSLIHQTDSNWEWIIVDDTDPFSPEGEANFNRLRTLARIDPRIRICRSDRNSALIGEVKNYASSLCRGEFAFELDHDDDILPNTFTLMKNAFTKYPDAGFAYSDFTEVYEAVNDDKVTPGGDFSYGEYFGLGYGCYQKELYPWLLEYQKLLTLDQITQEIGVNNLSYDLKNPNLNFEKYRQKLEFKNIRYYNVCSNPPVNGKTLRHIVGVPNHFRAWRTETLKSIGGYNPKFHVADDYELILRSFLKTRFVHIPYMCYIQYRNEGGNNFTFIRNGEIQKLVASISAYYNHKIHQRLEDLGVPDPSYSRQTNNPLSWTDYRYQVRAEYTYLLGEDNTDNDHPNNESSFKMEENNAGSEVTENNLKILNNTRIGKRLSKNPLISVIIPTYNREDKLRRAIESARKQTYQKIEILVVGDKCPTLDKTMIQLMREKTDSRIKWWNLSTNSRDPGTWPRNYACKMLAKGELIAYLDDDNYWEENHLESLYKKFEEDPSISYAFSSFVMDDMKIKCREPKKARVDTSALLHKFSLFEKYGFWKRLDQISNTAFQYAHDWELVSRWKNEKWAATGQFTLLYDTSNGHQNTLYIRNLYDDQD